MSTEPDDYDRSFSPLALLHTQRLSNPARTSALCGARDLLAVVHSSWDISVYRITSGQVAFAIKRKEEFEVQCLAWKANGTLLAVAWSDGAYGLHESERGGLISTGRVEVGGAAPADDWRLDLRPDFGPDEDEDGPGVGVSRFAWAQHRTRGFRKAVAKNIIENINERHDLNGAARANEATFSLKDLSASITLLDVTTILPRLSAIPTHGMSIAKAGPAGNKFATLPATDGVFESKKDVSTGLVQNLLVCQDDGTVQVLLDETVRIGSCSVGAKPIMQASHEWSPFHAVLTEDEDAMLRLHFIHLPLPVLGGPLLHVIATNTKRIQNLLDYVMHTVRCIEHDFTTGVQFPQRILNSLGGMLQDHDEGDAPSSLYHLAMTGDFSAPVLEWLTDIVKDPNHKRWDAAVGSMYSMLQHHLFTNLFPALDRLCIAASALRGQAAFHEGSSKFDCPPELFTKILSTVDCLRLVAEKALLIVTAESRQFRAFSRWLKMQIDIGLAEPRSKNALEIEEREVPSIEYPLVLRYIKETMMRSRLAPHVSTRPDLQQGLSQQDFFAHEVVRTMAFENTKNALRRTEKLRASGDACDAADVALVNLPTVTAVLQGHVRAALQQITVWQSRMLSAPTQLPIDMDESRTVFDMLLCPPVAKKKRSDTSHDPTSTATKLIAFQASRNEIELITARLPPTPPTKSRSSESTPHSSFRQHSNVSASNPPPSPPTSKYFAFPEGSQLLDAKFFSPPSPTQGSAAQQETIFLALVRNEDFPPSPRSTDLLLYTDSASSSPSDPSQAGNIDDDVAAPDEHGNGPIRVLHCFPAEAGFVPQSFVIGGREGKMVCVIWGNKGREWVVLDLESVWRKLPVGSATARGTVERGGGGGYGRRSGTVHDVEESDDDDDDDDDDDETMAD